MKGILCNAIRRRATMLGCVCDELESYYAEHTRLKREVEALQAENASLREKLAFRGPWF